MMELFNPKIFFNSLVYSILGVVVFWLSFLIIDKGRPATVYDR